MPENVNDYGPIVDEIYLRDVNVHKDGVSRG
jgi:hypothetical protein